MKHTEVNAILRFLNEQGYEASEETPCSMVKKNIAIDVFEDGLIQIWRICEDTQIGEFKIKSLEGFQKEYALLTLEKWGLK